MVKRKKTGGGSSGVMMILSPAKTLDLSPVEQGNLAWTSPDCDLEKTNEVASILRRKKESELSKTLGISAKLAKTARDYWSNFQDDPSARDDLKPSIYSFSGAAYQGLESSSCSESAISYMQDNLRIVDPLYGVLRPLDKMQPYRLEMATKSLFPDDKKLKLADWWRPSVCKALSTDLEDRDEKFLLNLASDEYSAAVDASLLPEGTQYIKVVFWEEGRTIAVHAKRARGLMVRYLAENAVEDMDGIKTFDAEGYNFVEDESDDSTIVFNRKKQGGGSKKTTTAKASTPKGRATKKTRKK